MLIVFEGIDGSGKTVQSNALKSYLEDKYGLKCGLFSFPAYETKVGQLIFNHLHDRQAFSLDPRIVSILYATNRMEFRSEIIRALEINDIVICNRYSYSNAAFQGAKVTLEKRSSFLEWIEDLEFKIFQLPRPDFTILLLLSPLKTPQLIAAKKDQTNEGPDEYELNREFTEQVYSVYKELGKTKDNWIPVKCYSDVEIFSREKVTELVIDALLPKIDQR